MRVLQRKVITHVPLLHFFLSNDSFYLLDKTHTLLISISSFFFQRILSRQMLQNSMSWIKIKQCNIDKLQVFC